MLCVCFHVCVRVQEYCHPICLDSGIDYRRLDKTAAGKLYHLWDTHTHTNNGHMCSAVQLGPKAVQWSAKESTLTCIHSMRTFTYTHAGNVFAHPRDGFLFFWRTEREGKQMDKWGETDWQIYKDTHYHERSMKRRKEESIEYEKMVEL